MVNSNTHISSEQQNTIADLESHAIVEAKMSLHMIRPKDAKCVRQDYKVKILKDLSLMGALFDLYQKDPHSFENDRMHHHKRLMEDSLKPQETRHVEAIGISGKKAPLSDFVIADLYSNGARSYAG